MKDKILLLCDSFKESISSVEIKDLALKFFKQKNVLIKAFGIADGGEGTVDFFIKEKNYEKVMVDSVNAFNEPIKTYYAYDSMSNTAVFDSAQIVGFAINNKLDIIHATTFGIGLVIKEIIHKGFKNILIGLGGSITNDGGSGMLEALGAKFYYDDKIVNLSINPFKMINKADFSLVFKLLKNIHLTILSDVVNPLLGPNGATNIYSIQKGSTKEERSMMESWMECYSKVVGYDPFSKSTGAAGGLGYAFKVIGADTKIGIDVILDSINIKELYDNETLVITGEGKIDKTSFSGKVVGKITSLVGIDNCAIICGIDTIKNPNYHVYPLHDEPTLDFKKTVKKDLEQAFFKILNDYKLG